MYEIQIEAHFDAAHFLKDYVGKCKNIHGHRWRVIVSMQGENVQETGEKRGMLVDFGQLKQALQEEISQLDHALILEAGAVQESTMQALEAEQFHLAVLPFRPTAENFAKYFYTKLWKRGYQIKRVCIYETPNNCASYWEDAHDATV